MGVALGDPTFILGGYWETCGCLGAVALGISVMVGVEFNYCKVKSGGLLSLTSDLWEEPGRAMHGRHP